MTPFAKTSPTSPTKPPSVPPSSPVVGTTLLQGKSEQAEKILSENLTDFWLALEHLANGLALLAQHARGQAAPPQSPRTLSPTSAPAPAPAPTAASAGTVAAVINDYLVSKARSGRSDRYLRALKNSLSKFARGRCAQPFGAVTALEVEEWLAAGGWAPRTQKGYLADVRTLYAFAMRRGYCTANPAAGVEAPSAPGLAPGIHTPEEVAAVLAVARARDPNVCRCLAVRYFAGLRASEAEGLREECIRPGEGIIEVPSTLSKTRRRRIVDIQPNLAAWLALGGELPLRDTGRRMRETVAAVAAVGVAWPHNAPRHSFCSYHLAAFESASRTALQAGHSETMLFAHYRAVVPKGAALRFWALFPTQAANTSGGVM